MGLAASLAAEAGMANENAAGMPGMVRRLPATGAGADALFRIDRAANPATLRPHEAAPPAQRDELALPKPARSDARRRCIPRLCKTKPREPMNRHHRILGITALALAVVLIQS